MAAKISYLIRHLQKQQKNGISDVIFGKGGVKTLTVIKKGKTIKIVTIGINDPRSQTRTR